MNAKYKNVVIRKLKSGYYVALINKSFRSLHDATVAIDQIQ